MAKSAPEVSFSVGSVNYGTIDVGASSAKQHYSIYQHGTSTAYANAINMSISFKESTNATEARTERWVQVSTAGKARTAIGSVGSSECYVGSTVAKLASQLVRTWVSVPVGATSAGRVAYQLHHRILAEIRRVCGYTSILVKAWSAILRYGGENPAIVPFLPL